MSATNQTVGEIRLQITKRFPAYDPEVITSFVNERYRDVCRLLDWTALKVRAVFPTIAPYQVGTVLTTTGSTAITGTLTVWTPAMTGRWIRFGGDTFYYTLTYVSPTTATLDRPYEGVSAPAVSHVIWASVYVMPADVRQVLELTILDPAGPIYEVAQAVLNADDPTRTRRSKPLKWAPFQNDSSTPERQQVELSPGPDKVYPVQLWYEQDPSMFELSDTAVFVPKWFSPNALFHGVEADIRRVFDKDANLFAIAESLFQSDVGSMKSAEAMRRGPTRLAQSRWQHRRSNVQRSEDFIDRYLSE